MKKITLLFSLLLVTSFGFSQNGGDTCGAAVAVTPGTFTGTLINDASNGSEMGAVGTYSSAWFSYTPTQDGTISINSCNGGSDTRLYVGTGTCGSLTVLDSNDDSVGCPDGVSGNDYASAVFDIPVTTGVTYYIEWDDRWDNTPTVAFDWTLEFQACISPTLNAISIVDNCAGGTFSVDFDFADLGTASSVVISNDYDASTVAVSGPGVYSTSSFPIDNNIVFTIEHDTDSACDIVTVPITDTCPPDNDLCAGAIPLTPGAVFETNPLTGQNQFGATDSGELPLPGCALYDPADVTGFGGDVWFSVVVPGDGNITIETQGDPSGNGGDTGMAVYSGACGSLVLVECDDDDSPDGNYSLVSVVNPALAGQTIYVRVWEYGGNNPLSFQISAYSATLSTVDLNNENAFSYFPNPVNDKLTLRAQNNIQNVSVYNMLGQEVVRTAPNTLTSEVDMNTLSSGAYFVQVTINDTTETIRVIKK